MCHTTHSQGYGRKLAGLTLRLVVGVAVLLGLASFNPGHASASTRATVWVDKASKGGRCSDARGRTTATKGSPLCTLTRAAAVAQAGDTVMIRAATYNETLRPQRSGTRNAPIRYSAAGAGVVIDASGRASGILVTGRSDLRFSGLTVKGARSQGVWVGASTRVSFDKLVITRNRVGMQLKSSSEVTVGRSTLSANQGAGIMELGGVRRGRYVRDRITRNGHDGQPYNGDGLQLDGSGTLISKCDITGNGDNSLYEHGIYASAKARGYTIESSRFSGNAASDIKAQGTGTVRYNLIGSARLGMYVDHSGASGVWLYYNVISGSFEHAVQTGAGARLAMTNNTVNAMPVNKRGDHAAVQLARATSVTLRNNIISNRNRSAAVAVGAGIPARALRADYNQYASADLAKVTAWHNRSMSLAQWRKATRLDARSASVKPPRFDRTGHVLAPARWRPLGQRVNLRRDFGGRALPRKGRPAAGARER
jgi:hypothetical protein